MTCIVCIPFIQQSDSVICQFDFFFKVINVLAETVTSFLKPEASMDEALTRIQVAIDSGSFVIHVQTNARTVRFSITLYTHIWFQY